MIKFIDQDKKNCLRLMVRDPSRIFAYWDLVERPLAEISDEPGASPEGPAASPQRWVLRLVRLQSGAATDITIDISAGNWYVPVAPDSTYEGELGVYLADGNYHSIVRGNLVRTPPISVSSLIDPAWYISDEDFLLLAAGMPGLCPGSYRGVAGSRSPEWVEPQGNLAPAHDAQIKPRK